MEEVKHGVNCTKREHKAGHYYVHTKKDDGPYSIDGISYCGRCHANLPKPKE